MGQPGADVWDLFLASVDALDLRRNFDTEPSGVSGRRPDFVRQIEGVPVIVEVKSVPQISDVLAFDRLDAAGAYKVMAGRRLSAATREALSERDMGYFDARGHLRLWRRPLLVDKDVPVGPAEQHRAVRPRFENKSLLDVALAVLDGTARQGVRATAAVVGRPPGTVSKQLKVLRDANLVDELGEPAVPDLFDAVAESWNPSRLPLADLPRPGRGAVNQRLQFGLDEPAAPGWVLADSFAAGSWGAPVVVDAAAPPDFYVPDSHVVRLARTLLRDAEFGRHACTVAAAPAPYVCRRRHDRAPEFDSPFLAPSAVVAALDLSIDPGHGREVLESWRRDLRPEIPRVW
jgi:hypothetical protein